MTDLQLPDPAVRTDGAQELARDLLVVPNRNTPLVPNIGIIGGTQAVLVVDTGLGPENAENVLAAARDHARGRRLYVTTTHFHPEHALGTHVFAGEATYLVNRAQAEDLAAKGDGYLAMFRGLGENVARRLEGARVPTPDVVYEQSHTLDLGGRVVRLQAVGRAHSKGDQVVTVPDDDVLFTGDLAETGQFAIFPWFPPHDTDVSGLRWIEVMERLVASGPATVVPGHGDTGGTQVLTDVLAYLRELRDETWARRDSASSRETLVEEVRAVLVERHPTWTGREWIDTGVACLCGEQP
ncbi:MBL fold metallo-hydrolase [Streptacidiphilus pinicola]|uniref:MBL fold metallo-hydrolase n=1 Tax=Streptacidiphilus pinicola TaxID=2219663 RepID=A0A2X0KEU8_9ACTN|nr:MBL fold metallo-hydrolase [Streptacidiphilus pinicola]RAG85669.1 MBL fold metallo-hydrolase [Streptacidiphilus pinicola]